MDAQTLTLLGIVLTAVIGIPTFGSWFEARRQRRSNTETPTASTAASPPARLRWRCGIYDYAPLSLIERTDKGAPSGPLLDLAEAVFAELDIEPEFYPFSYEDFYKGGSVPDAVLGMFRTDRRAEIMCFSRPIYEIGLQGICRIQQEGDILEQMREGTMKIAVYGGEVGWEFASDELRDAKRLGRIVVVTGGHQLDTMDHLLQRRYDVVLMDELSCVNFLRLDDNNTQFRLAFPTALSMYKCCFALNLEHAGRMSRINTALETKRNDRWFLKREATAIQSYEATIHRRGLRAQGERP